MAAGFKVYAAAAWHQATKISLYNGAAWIEVLRIRAWIISGNPPVGQWKDVYVKSGTTPTPTPSPTPTPTPPPPVILGVTISPTLVSGHRINAGLVTTTTATATATGGTPPYTYQWTRSSWSSVPPELPPDITSPNAAATTFSQTLLQDDEEETAVFKCIVQDSANPKNTGSATVNAQFLTSTREVYGHGPAGGQIP